LGWRNQIGSSCAFFINMSTATLLDRIEHLPLAKRRIIEKMVEALSATPDADRNGGEKHFTFSWEGALEDLRDQYTSVQLQKEILNEWTSNR
jgi:hypothetical protein